MVLAKSHWVKRLCGYQRSWSRQAITWTHRSWWNFAVDGLGSVEIGSCQGRRLCIHRLGSSIQGLYPIKLTWRCRVETCRRQARAICITRTWNIYTFGHLLDLLLTEKLMLTLIHVEVLLLSLRKFLFCSNFVNLRNSVLQNFCKFQWLYISEQSLSVINVKKGSSQQ
jgi:hypothetical protein